VRTNDLIAIDSFGNNDQDKCTYLEGETFLKTTKDRFKSYWIIIMGKELYCYRNKNDAIHRVMHCLIGTFTQRLESEKDPESKEFLHPLKIKLPNNKSRTLYF
jgi:hypothetical protein